MHSPDFTESSNDWKNMTKWKIYPGSDQQGSQSSWKTIEIVICFKILEK